MRIQTVDSGEPVAIYTVARELGHRDTKMVEQCHDKRQGGRSMCSVAVNRDSIVGQCLAGGEWGSEVERHGHQYVIEMRL